MEDQSKEITQLLNEFRYLKNAVMKNWVYKFITSKALRPLYLATGLAVFAFAALIQWLIQDYGSYGNIPMIIKTIYYSGLAVSLIWLSYTKLRLLIKNMRELGADITILQFFKAVYTWSTLVVAAPCLVALGLAVIFLISRGLSGYLVPCLAILYGLMLNSMMSIVYWRELAVGAVWNIVSGFAVLFILGPSQPLLGLTITFGLGFIVMYIASWIFSTGDQK